MDPTRLMTQQATITHVADVATGADEYNNPTYPTSTATVRCWLHQTQRSERTAEADTQIETWRLYLPPGTSVDGPDKVAVDGVTYELDGPPWPAFNPRLHRVTHIECTLRKVA